LSGSQEIPRTSLFGLFSFRPGLTVVLIILTITVAVVGYHISRGSGTRRVEGMAREAQRIFVAGKKAGTNGPPLDPGVVEERIRGWVGVKVALPRDERFVSCRTATRERIGNQAAAAVHLTFSEDPFLLLIVKPDALRAVEPSPLFPRPSFLSWEREGLSFVFWEKEGVLYVLVSDVDLTRTFDLVRQYFT
jgi:hypothetical protein